MPVTLSNKSIKFKQFVLHHLSFKNVNANDFDALYDAVNEYLFSHQAIIITSTLTGNRATAKTLKKAAKKVFEEINWPLNWIGSSKDSNLSGDFVAVSGVNVKAFMSSNFITKVFDTPDTRYVYVGDVFNDAKESKQQINEVQNTVDFALGMVGLNTINIVRSWYYCENRMIFSNELIHSKSLLERDSICTDNYAINNTIIESGNQHQKRLMASFFAIQAKNDKIHVQPIKGLFENMSAVLVRSQNSQMLLISKETYANTQSNDPIVANKIEKVLNSIEALMHDNGFIWSQLWRGIVYFNDGKDMAAFKKVCKDRQIPMASLLLVQTEFPGANNSFDIEADFVKINEE